MGKTFENSLALINGKIYTVDKSKPWIEALFCRDGIICKIGTTEEVLRFVNPRTKIIDLDGAFAMPGFNDAHVDFYRGALSLQSVQLEDAPDEAEFVHRIQSHAQKLAPGEWITEGNWNHENWPGGHHPTKELLDPVTPENPVLVCRLDWHVSVANSLALKIAGINRDTPDPVGGEIRREPDTGEPTGVLIDNAQQLVYDKIPPQAAADQEATIRNGLQYAASLGITSVQDNITPDTFLILQNLLHRNELTLRVNAWTPIEKRDALMKLGITKAFGSDFLRLGVVKIFADGSMGAGSALMFEPYTDNPATCGIAIYPEKALDELIADADSNGLQCAVHAIGDKANHIVLNAFEKAIAARNKNNSARRHRIEHSQLLIPEDITRFKKLGLIASVQPSQAIDDMKWAEKRIGPRVKNCFLMKTLLNNGIPLALGTDWPVAPLNPFITLFAAVARKPLDGSMDEWFPDERLDMAEAIECATFWPAYAEFAEQKKGTITEGKLADITVLSQNLFEIEPDEIPDTKVFYTIFNGQVIYQR